MQHHFYTIPILAFDLEISNELQKERKYPLHIKVFFSATRWKKNHESQYIEKRIHLRQCESQLRFCQLTTDAASCAHRERQCCVRIYHSPIITLFRSDPPLRFELTRPRKMVHVAAA